MTKITIDGFTLEAAGHAGFAQGGTDIVCAAVSMLAQAYEAGLVVAGVRYFRQAGDGYFRVTAYPEGSERDMVLGMLAMARAGLMMLEKNYPQNVRFAGEI